MSRARVTAVQPPYSEPVATVFDRVMPKGVPPLVLFRTLAVNEKVFRRLMANRLVDRAAPPIVQTFGAWEPKRVRRATKRRSRP